MTEAVESGVTRERRQARVWQIVTAATLSGVCGLSYEVLYTRMLATYFGSIFYVAAAVIAGFLLGIALASFVAHRYAHLLGRIEIGIGLFAVVAMLAFRYAGTAPLPWIGALADTPIMLALTPGLLILVPGLMIGATLPMFAIVLRHRQANTALQTNAADKLRDVSVSFRWVYVAYNLGGAICVMAIELVLVKAIGISAAGLCVAAVNIAVGLWLVRTIQAPDTAFYAAERKLTVPLSARRCLALVITGFVSGAFQILFLKIASHLWGATAMTVAGTLAAVLMGGALGAMLVEQYHCHLRQWLYRGAFVIAGFFAAMLPIIHTWALVAPSFYLDWGLYAGWCAQGLFVTLVGIPVFTVFGGTEPAALYGRVGTVFEAGKALGICALANAVGAVVMVFWIHPNVPDHFALAGMAILVMAAAFVDRDSRDERSQ